MSEDLIDIIANGVDVDIFRPRTDRGDLRVSMGLPTDRLIIGNVARLDPVKNHEMILRALYRLGKSGQRPFLLLVGEGPHRAALERNIAILGLTSDVCLKGYSDEIPELMNCMDIYVQPSLYEGCSYTILEAMACGLPILATDVGGTRDVLDNGKDGYLFQPDDDEAFAALILRLIEDPRERRALGCRARRRAIEHFPVQKTVRNYETIYRDLAARNHRSLRSE
jgi:glycosyltransferase involved in cell wall biosynthesis